jgi:hypothetical protein
MAQTFFLKQNGVSSYDFAYSSGQSEEKPRAVSITIPTPGLVHKVIQKTKGLHEKTAYLLSATSIRTLQQYWAYDSFKCLLGRPNTAVILLIPVKWITHPLILKIFALRKASGTCFNVIPFDPQSTSHDEEVARYITHIAKIKKIDGYMAFEEDAQSRMRLAQVVNLINI